jgi:hypothetical protein
VAKQPLIISTRFHAHRGKEQYLGSFREEGVRAIWRTAVELGLIIELHIGPSAQIPSLVAQDTSSEVMECHVLSAAGCASLEFGRGCADYASQVAEVLAEMPESVVLIDHVAEQVTMAIIILSTTRHAFSHAA